MKMYTLALVVTAACLLPSTGWAQNAKTHLHQARYRSLLPGGSCAGCAVPEAGCAAPTTCAAPVSCDSCNRCRRPLIPALLEGIDNALNCLFRCSPCVDACDSGCDTAPTCGAPARLPRLRRGSSCGCSAGGYSQPEYMQPEYIQPEMMPLEDSDKSDLQGPPMPPMDARNNPAEGPSLTPLPASAKIRRTAFVDSIEPARFQVQPEVPSNPLR